MSDSATDLPQADVLFDEVFRDAFSALLRLRRNEVSFSPEPVDEAALQAIFADMLTAPSVGLSQPWKFVQVESGARRAAVHEIFLETREKEAETIAPARREAYGKLGLAGLDTAPCHVALFLDPSENKGGGLGVSHAPLAPHYSVAIAAYTLWLSARAHNLAAGWVSILDEAKVKRALDVPAAWELVAYMCIGHPKARLDAPDLEKKDWSAREELDAFLLRR